MKEYKAALKIDLAYVEAINDCGFSEYRNDDNSFAESDDLRLCVRLNGNITFILQDHQRLAIDDGFLVIEHLVAIAE